MRQPLKQLTYDEDMLSPRDFVEEWQNSLQALDIDTSLDAQGELIAVWSLEGRKLKYKRIEYDNCTVTLRVSEYQSNFVEIQIGLIHATRKPRGPETTHWRSVILSPEHYSSTAVIFSKLVIAAANLTRQGKIEPQICEEWLKIIEHTLGVK